MLSIYRYGIREIKGLMVNVVMVDMLEVHELKSIDNISKGLNNSISDTIINVIEQKPLMTTFCCSSNKIEFDLYLFKIIKHDKRIQHTVLRSPTTQIGNAVIERFMETDFDKVFLDVPNMVEKIDCGCDTLNQGNYIPIKRSYVKKNKMMKIIAGGRP